MNKEQKNLRSRWWQRLVDVLENEFPKNECKERGAALVLAAYAEIMFQEAEELLAQQKADLLKRSPNILEELADLEHYFLKKKKKANEERLLFWLLTQNREWARKVLKEIKKLLKEI